MKLSLLILLLFAVGVNAYLANSTADAYVKSCQFLSGTTLCLGENSTAYGNSDNQTLSVGIDDNTAGGSCSGTAPKCSLANGHPLLCSQWTGCSYNLFFNTCQGIHSPCITYTSAAVCTINVCTWTAGDTVYETQTLAYVDLSCVPSNASLISASLILPVKTTDTTVWNATSYNISDGLLFNESSVTWNTKNAINATNFSYIGYDISVVVPTTATIATTSCPNQVCTNNPFASLVRSWFNQTSAVGFTGGETNNGILVKINATVAANESWNFYSKDYSGATSQWTFLYDITPPTIDNFNYSPSNNSVFNGSVKPTILINFSDDNAPMTATVNLNGTSISTVGGLGALPPTLACVDYNRYYALNTTFTFPFLGGAGCVPLQVSIVDQALNNVTNNYTVCTVAAPVTPYYWTPKPNPLLPGNASSVTLLQAWFDATNLTTWQFRINATNTSFIPYSYDFETGESPIQVTAIAWMSQSFKTNNADTYMTNIDIDSAPQSTGILNFTFELWSASGQNATTSYPAAKLAQGWARFSGSTTRTFRTVAFNTTYNMSGNTWYFVVWHIGGGSSGSFVSYRSISTGGVTFPNGNVATSINNGSTWTVQATSDLNFRVRAYRGTNWPNGYYQIDQSAFSVPNRRISLNQTTADGSVIKQGESFDENFNNNYPLDWTLSEGVLVNDTTLVKNYNVTWGTKCKSGACMNVNDNSTTTERQASRTIEVLSPSRGNSINVSAYMRVAYNQESWMEVLSSNSLVQARCGFGGSQNYSYWNGLTRTSSTTRQNTSQMEQVSIVLNYSTRKYNCYINSTKITTTAASFVNSTSTNFTGIIRFGGMTGSDNFSAIQNLTVDNVNVTQYFNGTYAPLNVTIATPQENGCYHFNVTGTNSAGNTNTSSLNAFPVGQGGCGAITVFITTPLNNSVLNGNTTHLLQTSSGLPLRYCEFYANSTLKSNSTGAPFKGYINYSTYTQGSELAVNVSCFDSNGNRGNSPLYRYVVDKNSPIVTDPECFYTDNRGFAVPGEQVYCHVTAQDQSGSGMQNVTADFSNVSTVGMVNHTLASGGSGANQTGVWNSSYFTTITPLDDGEYYAQIYAVDRAIPFNNNSANLYIINVSNTLQNTTWNLTLTLNSTHANLSGVQPLTTIAECSSNGAVVDLSVNGTLIGSGYDVIFTDDENATQNETLEWNCSNTPDASFNFQTDTLYTLITFNSTPQFWWQATNWTNGSVYNGSDIQIFSNWSDNYSVSEVNLTFDSVNYTMVQWNGTDGTNGVWNFNISGLATGTYYYNFTATNGVYANTSSTFSLVIASALSSPIVTFSFVNGSSVQNQNTSVLVATNISVTASCNGTASPVLQLFGKEVANSYSSVILNPSFNPYNFTAVCGSSSATYQLFIIGQDEPFPYRVPDDLGLGLPWWVALLILLALILLALYLRKGEKREEV